MAQKHPKIIPIFLVNTLGDSDRIPLSSLYPPSSLQETQVGGCHGPHYSFIIVLCEDNITGEGAFFSSDFVFSVPSFIENNNKRKKRVASFWLRWRFSYLCTGQGSDWKIIFLACFLCMKYAELNGPVLRRLMSIALIRNYSVGSVVSYR